MVRLLQEAFYLGGSVALVWLVIGSVFFDVMLKQAKKRGNLLFY